MLPSISVYGCILLRLFIATLDIVASMVYLKIKYHKLQGNPLIINVDLDGVKRIYQALQLDHKECKEMEINWRP